jgi:hypothetical protein
VSADALARLQRMAEEEERSVSFLVDKAISEFVGRRSGFRGGPDSPAPRRHRRGGGD